MSLDPKIVRELQVELEDDLDRWDGDFDSWSEVFFDCPSNTLEEIFEKIPEDQHDEYWDKVQEIFRSLDPHN